MLLNCWKKPLRLNNFDVKIYVLGEKIMSYIDQKSADDRYVAVFWPISIRLVIGCYCIIGKGKSVLQMKYLIAS